MALIKLLSKITVGIFMMIALWIPEHVLDLKFIVILIAMTYFVREVDNINT